MRKKSNDVNLESTPVLKMARRILGITAVLLCIVAFEGFGKSNHSGPRFPEDAKRISAKTYKKLVDTISRQVGKQVSIPELTKANKRFESLIDEQYARYSTAPLNMKMNKNIYENLQSLSSYFNKVNDFYSKEFKPGMNIRRGAVGEYRSKYFGRTGEYPPKSEFSDYFFAKHPEIYDTFRLSAELAGKVDQYKKEIYSSSFKHELGLLQNFIKKQYGIPNARYRKQDLLIALMDSSVEQNNVYLLGKVFKVIQSIENGMLLLCTGPSYNTFTIFVETKKSYPDDYRFLKPVTVISDGYFKYTSILGQNNKVYKFKELEISAKYYFL